MYAVVFNNITIFFSMYFYIEGSDEYYIFSFWNSFTIVIFDRFLKKSIDKLKNMCYNELYKILEE